MLLLHREVHATLNPSTAWIVTIGEHHDHITMNRSTALYIDRLPGETINKQRTTR